MNIFVVVLDIFRHKTLKIRKLYTVYILLDVFLFQQCKFFFTNLIKKLKNIITLMFKNSVRIFFRLVNQKSLIFITVK